MTREELDALWFQAMRQSIEAGEDFIRYHFAALVAAEKDREIKRLQDMLYEQLGELTALRAEKQMRTRIEQLKDPVDETTLDVSGATCFSPEPAKWPERSVKKKEQPK